LIITTIGTIVTNFNDRILFDGNFANNFIEYIMARMLCFALKVDDNSLDETQSHFLPINTFSTAKVQSAILHAAEMQNLMVNAVKNWLDPSKNDDGSEFIVTTIIEGEGGTEETVHYVNSDMIHDGDSFVLNVRFEPESESSDFKSISRTLRIKFIHSVNSVSTATYTWEHASQTIYDGPVPVTDADTVNNTNESDS
jgi:hypothetical protein